MPREIKFRFWDKHTKKMHEVGEIRFGVKHGMTSTDLADYVIDPYGSRYCIVGENCELLEYTGLKDKQDKEIYEGDIVKGVVDTLTPSQNDIDAYYIVRYEDGTWNYSYSLQEVGQIPSTGWEIVGNIYENPELLSEDNNAK
jgi:uncharacterized phage protein (TIGR01671 family)